MSIGKFGGKSRNCEIEHVNSAKQATFVQQTTTMVIIYASYSATSNIAFAASAAYELISAMIILNWPSTNMKTTIDIRSAQTLKGFRSVALTPVVVTRFTRSRSSAESLLAGSTTLSLSAVLLIGFKY